MVLGASPVRLLVKLPVPVPFEVLLPAMDGFGEVLQHIPLAVTTAPPSVMTLPPDVAADCVIAVTAAVVTVGVVITWLVVNCTKLPYAVPALFVA